LPAYLRLAAKGLRPFARQWVHARRTSIPCGIVGASCAQSVISEAHVPGNYRFNFISATAVAETLRGFFLPEFCIQSLICRQRADSLPAYFWAPSSHGNNNIFICIKISLLRKNNGKGRPLL